MNKLTTENFSLLSGIFFGLTAVALGAFGAHVLSTIFSDSQMSTFQTATQYQMYHALILCGIGFFTLHSSINNKILKLSSYSFIIGIVLFSFSLYLYLASNIVLIAIITPFGGIFLIIGWFLLFYFALTYNKTTQVTKL